MAILKGKLRLNRPYNQNFIMGCILACLPGIYLALTGLGAGGGNPASQHVASITNSILYGLFTFFGWCSGTILNYLGPKITICIGGLGYPLFAGTNWAFGKGAPAAVPLFGGAFLGFSAGLLWTGAGFISFAYGEEWDKGKYITQQWSLSSVGGTIGALIAFAVNVHQTDTSGVSSAVYIVFIVIMCSAIVATAFLIVDPRDVVRDDGRHIAIFKKPTVATEIKGVLSVATDPKIIILLPAMFAAEMCLAPVSSINGYYFNLRTRSLNNLLFNFIMIPAPLCFSYVMDTPRLGSRRNRGFAAVSILGAITIGALVGLLGWIITENVDRHNTPPGVDWSDSGFAGGFILYVLFGIVDSCFQIIVQWVLASLSNDPVLCARYAGTFKGTVSLGMCIAFTLDAQTVSYKTQVIIQLVIYAVALCSMYYVLFYYVQDTNYFMEENVIVPVEVEQKAVLFGTVDEEVVAKEHLKEEIAAHSKSAEAADLEISI
ncbi:hypothetical protein D0Z07_4073 [Hyphodiscus hymeniophilus]|uniref:Membrane transporter n=1 Tax=Hyphodiscus hymeniophilus TaxID=353542 RepID=A0A9P6VLR8_9HELO|nr:hypothetical protein D0Z07_4073 [Hyphodiscus hymeniophilus]